MQNSRVSPDDVKRLRAQTGAGIMDAKAALQEADGDFDKAVAILRKKGIANAVTKAQRETRAGLVDAYVHQGRAGALISVQCETDFVARTDEFKELVRDLAMQVVAAHPKYVDPQSIPAKELAKEKAIYQSQLADQGKPQAVVDKGVESKLEKYYQEVCLAKQPFIKDPDKTIEQLISEKIAKLGENIIVKRFSRLELGEIK